MPLLRPCRNTAAFEVLPDEKTSLDLDAVERALTRRGYRRVVRAGVMLIMRRDVEVSVYRSGKMLLKTRDPDLARVLAGELVGVLGQPGQALRSEQMDRLAGAPGVGVGGG